MDKLREHKVAIATWLVGLALGVAVGYGQGFSAGKADGFAAGDKAGWGRAALVAYEDGFWRGIVDGCNAVFETLRWDYVYGNVLAGGSTLSKDTFCRDNGDHTNTPVYELPYKADTGD